MLFSFFLELPQKQQGKIHHCSELITTFTNFLGFNQLKITYLQTQKPKLNIHDNRR